MISAFATVGILMIAIMIVGAILYKAKRNR